MSTMIDPRGIQTGFGYNFAGRIATVSRADLSIEQYTPLQMVGLVPSGQGTPGNPALAVLFAEATADATDPRGFESQYRLDWWGLGTSAQITDPLGQPNPAGHMTVVHRDSSLLVTQVTDRLSRNTIYRYDLNGNATRVTNPDLTFRTFDYNPLSQVVLATDELSHQTVFFYDTHGNATRIQPPIINAGADYTYTSDGLVASATNGRGYTTGFNYDTRDRLTQVTYPDGDADPANYPKTTFVVDAASNPTSVTDERNFTTAFTYTAVGRPLTETDPLGHTRTFSYDAVGNLTGSANALGETTTRVYNSMNRLAAASDPLSNTILLGYDADGNLTTVTDPLGRITTQTWSALGYRSGVTTPLGFVTTFAFDAEGQPTTVTAPLNRITTYVFNNRGWLANTTDSVGTTRSFGYDAVGNRTSASDPVGTVNIQYDVMDRLFRVTDQLGNATSVGYDAASNRTLVTDPLSHMTAYAFDPRDRLVAVTGPDPDDTGPLLPSVTTYTLDATGNIVRVTDPVNNVTSWIFDVAGRVTTETDPLGKQTLYGYNAASEQTRVTDRRGQIRDFVYDLDGRSTQELWCPAGSPALPVCGEGQGGSTPPRIFAYTYDAAARLIAVNEPDSRYNFTYDAADRVLTIDNSGTPNMPQLLLTNTFDVIGRRTRVADNLAAPGQIDFTYDAASRTTSAAMTVASVAGPAVTFSYDAASRLTSLSRMQPEFPPGMEPTTDSAFTYDNANRLTAISHSFQPFMGSPTPLAAYSYTYNAANELISETHADGTFAYSYDLTGQLTGVTVAAESGPCTDPDGPGPLPSPCDESFSYDVNGNRTLPGYTTGAGNRLTSDGVFNYTFDDNGNTILKSQISNGDNWEYTWDFRNRLTRVILKNSAGTILQQSDFVYDAFDRRIIKTSDSDGPGPQSATSTATIYDGASFAANSYIDFIDPDGPSGPQPSTLDTRRLFGPAVDMLLARRDASGTIAWYLTDHLGTVRDLVDTSGSVLDHISYSVYGKVTSESNPANGDRFKFTGREYDFETGLYYYRARYYEPTAGRFLSVDPLGFAAGNENLFGYVDNSPLGSVDPDGEQERRRNGTSEGIITHNRTLEGLYRETAGGNSGHMDQAQTAGGVGQAVVDAGEGLIVDASTRAGAALGGAVVITGAQTLARGGRGRRLWAGIRRRLFGGADEAAEAAARANPAHSAAQLEQLNASLRARMGRPHTTNPRLSHLMDELYRPGAKLGSGSTAAAVREELATGTKVGGKLHTEKAEGFVTAIQKWLRDNSAASAADRAAAENVLRDLQNALNGN